MTSGAGASYTYNVQGLRTKKTVGSKTANFTLVGGKVVSDGTSNYFWATELVTNGSVYYLYNAHGDVIQLLNSSGAVTKTYDYDAYGNELTRDQNDSNPFRYCGEYYDTETGFIYLRARYYNPSTGRFISVDPVKDGINWYAYCGNNPLSNVDPWGLRPKDLSPQATAVCFDGSGGTAGTAAKTPSNDTKKTPSKMPTNLAEKANLASKSAAQAFGQASQQIAGKTSAKTFTDLSDKTDFAGKLEDDIRTDKEKYIYDNTPGTFFDNMDDAAKGFAHYMNAKSIAENKEYASFIYEVDGQYAYVKPWKGNIDGVYIPINWFGLKNKVAEIHTHGAYSRNFASEEFSTDDKDTNYINYVVTPSGIVYKYDPIDGSIIPIYEEAPYDINCPYLK